MSQKYIGGYVSDTTTFTSTVSGDPQFNYVTMLLHGDGTNASQNNTFIDSSTNNFTITRNGNTTQGSLGPFGSLWSNYFDGSSAYLSWTGNDCSSGTWTLEAWVYPTANGGGSYGGRGIICCGDVYLNMGFDASNHITLRWYTGSAGYSISSTTALTLNTWYHVAVTFQSSTSAKVFVNGVSEASTTANLTLGSATSWTIGREGAQASYFPGYISNARVSSSILYSANFTPSTTPLTASSTTNVLTCQSNRYVNNSTYSFNITPNGSPSVQRFSPFGATTAYSTSVIGGSGYFDGSGDYLTAASNAAFNFGSNNFTVEFWINTAQTTSNATLITREWGGSPYTGGWSIQLNGSSSTAMTIYWADYSTGSTFMVASTTAYRDSAWHHVAWVRNGSSFVLYLDGVSVATATSATAFGTNTNQLTIGNDQTFGAGARAYNGLMAGLRIVNGTAVYTGAFIPPTAPLTAITNTALLLNYTNAGIYNNAAMNDLETVGDAQISTSVYKYGTGSMKFDGTGDWLLAPSSPNLNLSAGNWTVEFWYYPTTYSSGNNVITYIGASSADKLVVATIGTSGYLYYLLNGSTVISTTSAATLNAWSHVALVKNSTTTTLYLNGTSVGTTTSVPTSSYKSFTLGADAGGAAYIGYIDDLRITNGYARYTTTFTPPTAAFPNYTTSSTTYSILPTALAASGIWTMEQQGYYKAQSLWPTPPNAPPSIEYLVVAGGGAGGSIEAGGGGAGGFRTATGYTVTAGSSIAVVVGAGGAGNPSMADGLNGGNSSFGTVLSLGGGGGGGNNSTVGVAGGSGGGGPTGSPGTGGLGTSGQGNNGGAGKLTSPYVGGGGGGASASGVSGSSGGTGGAGTASSITGTSVTYAGGGGAGAASSTSAGSGGAGGGASGVNTSTTPSAATANTGGGGGGSGYNGTLVAAGGNGGSGIVVIRYANTYGDAAVTTGSPAYTNSGGYKIYTFTSSGTITF